MTTQNAPLNDLQDLARALGLNDHHLSCWLRALALPNGRLLAAFCHRQAPAHWASGPSDDALAWADGNPNGFGYGRALDALSCWGASWPTARPLSARSFYSQLLLAQALSLFLGNNPFPRGYAPALRDGRLWLLRYNTTPDGTLYALYAADSDFGTHWDYDLLGQGGQSNHRPGAPSLDDASSALHALLDSGDGAGWVAQASR